MKKRRTQDQSSLGPSITNIDNVNIGRTAVVTPRHFESGPTPSVSTGTPGQPPGLLSSPQNTSRPTARGSPAVTPPPTRPRDTLPELCIDRILKGDHEPSTYIQQSIFIVRPPKFGLNNSADSARQAITMVNSPPAPSNKHARFCKLTLQCISRQFNASLLL